MTSLVTLTAGKKVWMQERASQEVRKPSFSSARRLSKGWDWPVSILYVFAYLQGFFHDFVASSFIGIVEYIFTVPGVTIFLSERLCQDPLEQYFGKQRQRGRAHDNTNVREFLNNQSALRVVNSTAFVPIRGNCYRKARIDMSIEKENAPIPKRRKKWCLYCSCATEY